MLGLQCKPGCAVKLTDEQVKMLWDSVGGLDKLHKKRIRSLKEAVLELREQNKSDTTAGQESSGHSKPNTTPQIDTLARVETWLTEHNIPIETLS